MEELSNEEILDALRVSIPYLRQLTKDDLTVTLFVNGVCDTCYKNSSSDGGVEPGFDMSQDPSMRKVMQTGQPVHNVLPREIFNKSLEGEVVPVKNARGEVIAVLTSGYETEKLFQVEASSAQLATSIHDIKESIGKIAGGSSDLGIRVDSINEKLHDITAEIASITTVVNQIQKGATQSNMLALNASIEAARAGESGKGFAVVANEMGKFSKASSNSAKSINDKIQQLYKYIDSLQEQSNSASEISAVQSKEVSDITTNIESISKNAKDLNDLAKS